MALNKEQQLVVETMDKNLLVSASAGSGKTHTMIERIFYLIKDKKASLKNMLVVTFTNASAREMKERVTERLLKEAQINEHLKEQLSLISICDISTLHTFCAKLVKQYFYEVSVDPASKVMEAEESLLLKNESLTDLITEYNEKDDPVFYKLFEMFHKKRRDLELKEAILKLYEFLKTKFNYEAFIEDVVEKTYTTNLDENLAAVYLNNVLKDRVEHFTIEFELLRKDAQILQATKLEEVCVNALSYLTMFKKENNFSKNLGLLNSLGKLTQMPGKVNDSEEELKVKISTLKTEFKKEMTKLQEWFGTSLEEVESALKNARPMLEKMLELVVKFDKNYTARKRERAVLDFNDLEYETLEILKNETIRKTIQERYDYVFIDEYQDTNEIQEKIINLIVRENNAFMVGDVKQSIYMFREANPQIFVSKYEKYQLEEKSLKIDLNQNFRSERGVLEFSNFVFSNIMKKSTASVDYKKTAMFVSGASYNPSISPMPLVGLTVINASDLKEEKVEETLPIYSVQNHIKKLNENLEEKEDDVVYEARIIANKIFEFLNTKIYDVKEAKYRDVNFSDIAILTRVRSEYVKNLKQELEEYNIPLNVKYKQNSYDSYEANLLHSYLRLINNVEDDYALFTVLTSFICNITYNELSEIRIANLKSENFYDAVFYYCNNVNTSLATRIKKLLLELEEFRFKTTYLTVAKLMQEIVQKYELENYLYSLPSGNEKLVNLKMVIASANKEEFKNDLFMYLNYIETFSKLEESEITTKAVENSVTITTIHASKGLEYPIVILANMGRSFQLKPNTSEVITNKDLGFGVKHYDFITRTKLNTLVRNAIHLKNKEEELAEEMRLLYVSLTRAKNHLWMVGKIDLNKLELIRTNFAILNAKSSLEWVLGGLDSAELKALKMGSETLNVSLLDGTNFKIEVADLEELKTEKNETSDSNFNKTNELNKEKLEAVFSYRYPYEESTHILNKSSVTEIVREEEEEEPYSIKAFKLEEAFFKKEELDFSLIGSVHHLIMQHIDLNLKSIEEIEAAIKKLIEKQLIPQNSFELIHIETIFNAVMQISALIKNAITIKKEEQFMMYVPYNEVFHNSKITDKILIQGVIDLIVETPDEVYILDYKTSRMTEDNLKQKYNTQLELYKKAYELAVNKKVNKKLIYSFHLNHIVNV